MRQQAGSWTLLLRPSANKPLRAWMPHFLTPLPLGRAAAAQGAAQQQRQRPWQTQAHTCQNGRR